jgi:N-acetylglucosaminyl-diphospho-decaprenol L-rhamnosyltransferase
MSVLSKYTGNASDTCAVTVIVVNYNAGKHLVETLHGLSRQTFGDFLAIVIDNDSTDGSLFAAEQAVAGDARFQFVAAGENLGFAVANNRAAGMANTEWLALLNPDAVPQLTWLQELMRATKRHPQAALFGSTQLDAADTTKLDGAGDCYLAAGLPWRGGHGWPVATLPVEGKVFSPCAAAALYRRDVFLAAGGFCEAFFCYIEDVDLGFRLRLRGHHAIQVPAAVVHHVGGGSSGEGASDFARYHGVRNMIWCFVQNMPSLLFWLLLPAHIVMLIAYGVMATLRGHTLPFLAALRDATGGLGGAWRRRIQVQAQREVSWWRLAAALSWNPCDCWQRRAHGRVSVG